MTFPANNPGAAVIGEYSEIAALHGNTKTAVDAVTTKLEAMRLLLVAIGGYEDGVEGFLDGVEGLIGATNTALTTQNGYLDQVETKLDALATLLGDTTTPAPITATALPLPAGASTETTLAAVNTKTPTQGQKVKSGSVPVTLASDHDPIDTVIKSTATSRSAIVGFVGTAAAATTASTTLTVTVTTGVPMIGQTVSGTGITAGTTITAVSGTAPYSLTLSAAATVASGAAVTSVGMQVLMPANTARRGFVIQNQHASAKFWINGVGNAAADASSLLISANSYYDTSAIHTGTGAISVIGDTPGIMLYAREF